MADLQQFINFLVLKVKEILELIGVQDTTITRDKTKEFVKKNFDLFELSLQFFKSYNIPEEDNLCKISNQILDLSSSVCSFIGPEDQKEQTSIREYKKALRALLTEVQTRCTEICQRPAVIRISEAENIGHSISISVSDVSNSGNTEEGVQEMGNSSSLLMGPDTPVFSEIEGFETRRGSLGAAHSFPAKPKNHFPELIDVEPALAQGYSADLGNEKLVSLNNPTPLIDYKDEDVTWYKSLFVGKRHRILLGNQNQSVVIIVFLLPEHTNTVKAMIFSKNETKRCIVPSEFCESASHVQAWLTQQVGIESVYVTPFTSIQEKLIEYEEKNIFKKYKFGILYAKDKQTDENEMFSNCDPSPDFQEFLDWIGETIYLKGWEKYRGGLDVNTNSTGEKSIFTTIEDIEIMFHVSTMLPFQSSDPQRIERKRHLGNDVINIIFKEGDTPFNPLCLTNQFNNIFCVISKDLQKSTKSSTFYKIGFVNKVGVPAYSPFLKDIPLYEKNDQFRVMLLTKLVNGERAAMRGPDFKLKNSRTRSLMLDNIYNDALPLSKIMAETVFKGKSALEIQRNFDQDGRHFTFEGSLIYNGKENFCILLSSFLVGVKKNVVSPTVRKNSEFKILFAINLTNSQIVSGSQEQSQVSFTIREAIPSSSFPFSENIEHKIVTQGNDWYDNILGCIHRLSNDSFEPELRERDFAIFKSAAIKRTYSHGDVLINQGQEFENLFIIESGKCEIFIDEKSVAIVGNREILGERGFLGEKANARVQVLSKTAEILILDRNVVFSLLKLDANFSREFFRFIITKVASRKFGTNVRQGIAIANQQICATRALKLRKTSSFTNHKNDDISPRKPTPRLGPSLNQNTATDSPRLNESKLLAQFGLKDEAVLKTVPAHVHAANVKFTGHLTLFSRSLAFYAKSFGIKSKVVIPLNEVKNAYLEVETSDNHFVVQDKKKTYKFGISDLETSKQLFEAYKNIGTDVKRTLERRMSRANSEFDLGVNQGPPDSSKMSPADWRRIFAVGVKKVFYPQNVIIPKDFVVFSLSFLVSGSAKVVFETFNNEQKNEELGSGQVLGEISLMYPGRAFVSIVSTAETQVIQIPFLDLERLFTEDIALAARFYAHVCTVLLHRLEKC